MCASPNVIASRISKSDLGYLPSDGETLEAYAYRLTDICQQTRHDTMTSHDKWYTHYGAGPCWICNMIDMCDYMCSLLKDIQTNDKKARWKIVRPTDSYDAMTFTLRRVRL